MENDLRLNLLTRVAGRRSRWCRSGGTFTPNLRNDRQVLECVSLLPLCDLRGFRPSDPAVSGLPPPSKLHLGINEITCVLPIPNPLPQTRVWISVSFYG